ncbi:MAG: biotin transporter BioY [Clostridiales bacterium]|nr:biotin transporter BioY [Clostridiales bacterium]
MKITTKKCAFYALFAALTVICAQIAIPLPGNVPLSLATFAVMLSGALLGMFGGAVSQFVYVLLGAVGVPVFASFSGGLGRIVGPTGGYIIGYIFMALVIGLIVTKTKKKFYIYLLAMVAGTIVCYTFGTAWYVFSTKTALLPALTACVFPFLPGDAIKIILASLIACQLQKHIKLS